MASLVLALKRISIATNILPCISIWPVKKINFSNRRVPQLEPPPHEQHEERRRGQAGSLRNRYRTPKNNFETTSDYGIYSNSFLISSEWYLLYDKVFKTQSYRNPKPLSLSSYGRLPCSGTKSLRAHKSTFWTTKSSRPLEEISVFRAAASMTCTWNGSRACGEYTNLF